MTESDATGQYPAGQEPQGPDSAAGGPAEDPDSGPASEPTGASGDEEAGSSDQDAGPASEPGAAQGEESPPA